MIRMPITKYGTGTMNKPLHYRAFDRFEIDMPEPFDLSLTVAKPAGWHWSTPGEVFQNGTLWGGTYLNSKPVGLKLSAVNERVTVSVYVQSHPTNDEETMLRTAIKLGLGEDEELEAFYEFARTDEVLSIAVQDLYGMRVGRLDDLFGRVILATTLQMAPLKRSQDMMARLLERYGAAREGGALSNSTPDVSRRATPPARDRGCKECDGDPRHWHVLGRSDHWSALCPARRVERGRHE